MCVAIPGRVTALHDGIAQVDFNGNSVNAMTGLVNIEVGDYALVHAGCIIQKMKEKEAEDLIALLDEINEGLDKTDDQTFKRI